MSNNIETVVITGASAGLGRAIAKEFAKHKANLVLISRGEEGLEGVLKEVESFGAKAIIIPIDVSKHEQVENAAIKAEKVFGQIDIWINNAMTSVFSTFDNISPEEFKRVTEVNYLGYVYGTMSALKKMKKKNKGTIVQVGSALSYRSIPLQSAYCGSKHAINGFTDSIRSELIHDKSKIHITTVQMPAMNTPQFEWVLNRLPKKPQPVPPIFQPEVCAKEVYKAAHKKRREIFVGFSTLKAITGNKIIPGLLDKYLARAAYNGQQTDKENTQNKNNLWTPLHQDYGTHGPFDKRSRNYNLKNIASKGVLPVILFGGLSSLLYVFKLSSKST